MIRNLPLIRRFPALAGALPYVPLAQLPTPVERLASLEAEAGAAGLWVKRDDLSAALYGGNKVRKLEFLFGEVLAAGATNVLTFGAVGSNHALATAVYATQLGLRPATVVSPQHNARYAGRNVLAQHAVGAKLFYREEKPTRLPAVERLGRREGDRRVAVIPFGGTSPLGTVGYVNAAFELAEQVAAGDLPEPDVLYVALGSMGTAAGLAVGIAAAGLSTRLVPVRVTPEVVANEPAYATLVRDTVALLRQSAPDFPDVAEAAAAVPLRHDAFGEDYALFTEEGQAAVETASRAGLRLEGTYTGKTFAALLADGRAGVLGGKTALFWNTYNSHDISALTSGADWRDLPPRLHRYFLDPVQPLDR